MVDDAESRILEDCMDDIIVIEIKSEDVFFGIQVFPRLGGGSSSRCHGRTWAGAS